MQTTFASILKILVFTGILLSPVSDGFCCVNSYELIPGVRRHEGGIYELQEVGIFSDELRAFITAGEKDCNIRPDTSCSDLAIAYMYDRQYAKALSLTKKLILLYPNEYNVVMSHATALELNGYYEDAYTFVQKGISLDSLSHEGSEWIHLKILEWIISGKTDPDASILSLHFGGEPAPRLIDGRYTFSLFRELHYQLNERINFVEPPNDVMARLLFDYANLAYLEDYRTVSLGLFQMAREYGSKNYMLEERIANSESWIRKVAEHRERRDRERVCCEMKDRVRTFKDGYIRRQQWRIYGLAGFSALQTLLLILLFRRYRKKKAEAKKTNPS